MCKCVNLWVTAPAAEGSRVTPLSRVTAPPASGGCDRKSHKTKLVLTKCWLSLAAESWRFTYLNPSYCWPLLPFSFGMFWFTTSNHSLIWILRSLKGTPGYKFITNWALRSGIDQGRLSRSDQYPYISFSHEGLEANELTFESCQHLCWSSLPSASATSLFVC